MKRYITTWRKPDDILEWDHFVSDSVRELETVIANIKKRGVKQFYTYPIGDVVDEYSSEY